MNLVKKNVILHGFNPQKAGFAGDVQAQMELGEARLARVGCHRKGVLRGWQHGGFTIKN